MSCSLAPVCCVSIIHQCIGRWQLHQCSNNVGCGQVPSHHAIQSIRQIFCQLPVPSWIDLHGRIYQSHSNNDAWMSGPQSLRNLVLKGFHIQCALNNNNDHLGQCLRLSHRGNRVHNAPEQLMLPSARLQFVQVPIFKFQSEPCA